MSEITNLSDIDRKDRVAMLLRRTDEFIKSDNLEKALEVIRNVYQYDIKNMYARAFEERILAMIVERDGQLLRKQFDEQNKKIQKEIEKNTQIAVNKKLKEYYQQWEEESKLREVQEKQEIELELKAKEAALVERQLEWEKTYQQLQEENRGKGGDVEQTKAIQELQRNHELHVEKIKRECDKQISEVQQQADENEKVFSSRELLRFRWRSIEVYRSIILALDDYKVESAELMNSLRGILDISDAENEELVRSVKIDAYIKAVRKAWELGAIGKDDQHIIDTLRTHYGISEEENENLVRQIKADLGIPDDNTMILIVDDSPDVLLYCSFALKKTYKNVKTAESVDAALKIITTETPSLIISDVMMPEVSGFQFYDNIKNGLYGAEIQKSAFMFMSACDDDYMKKIAERQGIKNYLTKPTAKETLLTAVKEMLTQN